MSIKINSVKEIINRYDHFIFDMDGVLVFYLCYYQWTGGQNIETGVKGVQYLIDNGK